MRFAQKILLCGKIVLYLHSGNIFLPQTYTDMKKNPRVVVGGIVFALFVIAAGALLMLFNLQALPAWYKPIVFSWQTLLIAGGLLTLFFRRGWGMSVVLVLVGGFLLLPKFDINGLEFLKHNALAVLIIAVGFMFLCHLLFGNRHRHSHHCRRFSYSTPNWTFTSHDDEDGAPDPAPSKDNGSHKYSLRTPHGTFTRNAVSSDFIEYNCVFNHCRRRVNIGNFKGGEVNCVFGNFELDFTKSRLAGGSNVLELNVVFGSAVLYVPADWNVKITQSDSAFGSFADKRPPRACPEAPDSLTICGSVVFGSCEIRVCETPLLPPL